jgi:hypothetical protein
LDLDNADVFSANIDVDVVKIMIADPLLYSDPTSPDVKGPTIIEYPVVRQIDKDNEKVKFFMAFNTVCIYIYVTVGLSCFAFFVYITGGRDDPYLWGFLETMQVLSHI